MDFQTVLTTQRKSMKMTMKELERLSGVSDTMICNYEHGMQPPLDKAHAILLALDISMVIGARAGEQNG